VVCSLLYDLADVLFGLLCVSGVNMCVCLTYANKLS